MDRRLQASGSHIAINEPWFCRLPRGSLVLDILFCSGIMIAKSLFGVSLFHGQVYGCIIRAWPGALFCAPHIGGPRRPLWDMPTLDVKPKYRFSLSYLSEFDRYVTRYPTRTIDLDHHRENVLVLR